MWIDVDEADNAIQREHSKLYYVTSLHYGWATRLSPQSSSIDPVADRLFTLPTPKCSARKPGSWAPCSYPYISKYLLQAVPLARNTRQYETPPPQISVTTRNPNKMIVIVSDLLTESMRGEGSWAQISLSFAASEYRLLLPWTICRDCKGPYIAVRCGTL